jgi:hypothetical protein
MTGSFRKLILGLLLGLSAWASCPAAARSDTYWDNHWGWYDRTYRPYYTRRYYYGPQPYYYAPPAPYYGGSTYYYGPAYGPSYGYPYGAYYGGGVQVGPLRFGWW